jgi:hypothetical protein
MTGNFHFAWVEEADTTWSASFARWDEDVFAFQVSQTEGEFAGLDLDIGNPQVGLLCASRKHWAWLAWDNGTTIVPLFFGRLVGIPNDINLEVVKLAFTARPLDFLTQKRALAETMKEAPYWDPVFIDEAHRDDPDTVLEARSSLWHIDRVTHELTASDVLAGEDGNEEFAKSEVPYDSVQIMLDQPPLRSVTIDATVPWTQPAVGEINLRPTGYQIDSFTGDGLVNDWPDAGKSMGGGWEVSSSDAVAVPDWSLTPEDNWKVFDPDFEAFPRPRPIPADWINIPILNMEWTLTSWQMALLVPLWHVRANLSLGYSADRRRSERVRFTLNSNVQPIITLPSEEESPIITINGADVGESIPDIGFSPASSIPIGDPLRRSYFPTDRGLQSLEYLISLARARLLLGARVVQVTFACTFERAIDLSLRKNALIDDRRLPGGQALGKIIAYNFAADGQSGSLIGSVTIGCAIGRGETVAAVDGDPGYVEVGYVDTGYQYYSNQIVILGGGDVGYTVPIDAPNDDGLILTQTLRASDVISNYTVTNASDVQLLSIIGSGFREAFDRNRQSSTPRLDIDPEPVKARLKTLLEAMPTTVNFTLAPVSGGPFVNQYDISVTDLEVPKMIDLEVCA